jgi:hypothetical protein
MECVGSCRCTAVLPLKAQDSRRWELMLGLGYIIWGGPGQRMSEQQLVLK